MGKKLEGKGKKFQYGWLSECWFWYDIDWAHILIANETEVLRTLPGAQLSTKTKKSLFVVRLPDLGPHHMGKKQKRCVYGLGFGRKRPNPCPSPNNYVWTAAVSVTSMAKCGQIKWHRVGTHGGPLMRWSSTFPTVNQAPARSKSGRFIGCSPIISL